MKVAGTLSDVVGRVGTVHSRFAFVSLRVEERMWSKGGKAKIKKERENVRVSGDASLSISVHLPLSSPKSSPILTE